MVATTSILMDTYNLGIFDTDKARWIIAFVPVVINLFLKSNTIIYYNTHITYNLRP